MSRAPSPAASCRLYLITGARPDLTAFLEAAVAGRPQVRWINAMVPVAEVVQLYSHAAAFVCPSIYEPFGLINLEAMACGTAVVASRVGGIPEVVVDGETGWLVEPGDAPALGQALRAALADPARARSMGEAGRRRVEAHFAWDRIAERTLEVYRHAIADHGRGRLEEEQRLLGHDVAELPGVLEVVAAHADDLAWPTHPRPQVKVMGDG